MLGNETSRDPSRAGEGRSLLDGSLMVEGRAPRAEVADADVVGDKEDEKVLLAVETSSLVLPLAPVRSHVVRARRAAFLLREPPPPPLWVD